MFNTFDDLYFLDLHGNTRRSEVSPDGSKDENVFDIQQGVSVSILVKKPQAEKSKSVYHADLWGSRKSKYEALLQNSIETTLWKDVKPTQTYYFFIPKNFDLEEEYLSFANLRDSFEVSGPGIKTERDRVSIHWSEQDIRETVNDFRTLSENALRDKYNLGKDSRDWKISNAKMMFLKTKMSTTSFQLCTNRST